MNVAIIGASNKPDRYSYQAVMLLAEKGHAPYPVHPSLDKVDVFSVSKTASDIPVQIHTVTVYLSAKNQGSLGDDILKSKARRVIFNPGTENPDEYAGLTSAGIEALEACTLVLLRTSQF